MHNKELSLIKSKLKSASNIFIMGHRDIDLDAFGAAIGICCYASINKKNSYIIIDDEELESSVQKAVEIFKDKVNIIKSTKLNKLLDNDSLLVVVDTNKPYLLQQSSVLCLFKNVVVIDHHNLNEDSIKGGNIVIYNEPNVSSTCEIITNMLIIDNYIVSSNVAMILLSGIVLDTNNFSLKTNSQTYFAAYYLSKCGADTRKVQDLLKQDIKRYIEMQKVITEVELINGVALSKGLQTKIYRKEELAKIADTLLLFNNVETSFVVARIEDAIGISSRTTGKIDVGKFLEKFGGGGDKYEAAAVVKNMDLNKTFENLKKEINNERKS